MSLQLIPKFKKERKLGILWLIDNIARQRDVECMNLTGMCPMTGDRPVYVFTQKGEVVILMIDWRSEFEEELADEEGFIGQPPLYFSHKDKRESPVWHLTEFARQYKQIMIDANVKVTYVWSILISNSTFINYNDMTFIWEMAGVTVFHGYGKTTIPAVHYANKFHGLALAQYKAFVSWCERQGSIPKDPYAFEDIDADYDEMEFGLDKDDNCLDEHVFDSSQSYPGTIELSQNKIVNVEILSPTPSPRKELEKLVGCQSVKSQISDLLELTRYNRWMHIHYPDWKQHQVSLHALFIGRPGTGKTTVCKIYGALLKEVGALSKGHVVVCNRGTFVGSNWGDEESAIRQVLEMAKGGVLMIDEAYLFNSSNPNDPGKLIIPQFMDVLSNERQRDVAIVLCGYKEPMQKLLDLNPGLASRFPNRLEFNDFSIEELMQITLRRLTEYGYHFTRAGLIKYRTVLTEAYSVRNPNNWGNARYVTNLLEKIYLLHAKRCMKHNGSHHLKTFFSITPSDIQPIDIPKEKKRIGF